MPVRQTGTRRATRCARTILPTVKAIRRFTVRTVLPEALAPLGELALNLRWCWDTATQQLFTGLDPALWSEVGGDWGVRQGDAVFVYVNECPHIGTPLEWVADRFLSVDGSRIVCATHGAEFRIADGECLRGPCFGDRLEPVVIQIKDGTIYVPEGAGL